MSSKSRHKKLLIHLFQRFVSIEKSLFHIKDLKVKYKKLLRTSMIRSVVSDFYTQYQNFTSVDFRWTNRQQKTCLNSQSNQRPALVYMTTALTIQLSKRSFRISIFFSEWYWFIESILARHDVYAAREYSEAISNQAKLMLSSSPPTKGKYDSSKEWKALYAILIYNITILLPLTFDKQTDMKRYAWSGKPTYDHDWFTWPVL